ncbi:MAG: DNA polymerase III subunit beta [Planctomycetota bacterium]|nr:DNA polymerase III subunit beta [Planctomycetota bacterium]
MEFSIEKQAFSEALSQICGVVPERCARLILQNLMLTLNPDDTITLAGTDLEIGLKITLAVKQARDAGAILLPASRLNALVKGSLANELRLAAENNLAEISAKHGRFQLPGMETADYPAIPEIKDDGAIFIHGDDFADAVQKTVFATAKGDTRYTLNGIYMNIDGDAAEFVASDTNRLSYLKKAVRNPDHAKSGGILITKGMTTLARLAADSDALQIKFTENAMLAKTANAEIVIHLVEGIFPRYAEVIPPKSETSFTVGREELLLSLQSAGIMSPEEVKGVLFSLSPGRLDLSTSSDHGEADIGLDAELSGPEISIKFNYLFLIDVLKNLSDDKVVIQYTDGDKPVRIDSGDFMYVLMPINR